MDLIVQRPEGLYCPPGDFYIDPWRPVPRAVITHAHADHARRGHGAYLATGVQIPGSTADEAENADADLVFVSRNYDDTAGNDFGHLVAWLPVTTLTNRVVTAGRLP